WPSPRSRSRERTRAGAWRTRWRSCEPSPPACPCRYRRPPARIATTLSRRWRTTMRAESLDDRRRAPTQLVDTSILSELARSQPDPGISAWARGATRFALSAVTVEELYHALGRRPDPGLRSWIDAFATDE